MLELNGKLINYYKLVHSYMKREQIPLEDDEKYIKMGFTKLSELIKQKYEIKGQLDWKSMQKAKLIERNESEHDIQVKICKYCKEHKIGHFAVPNGFVHNGSDKLETIKYINYMKSEGLYPGVPDMVILAGNGKVGFLEVKTEKGRPSEQQIKWQKYLSDNGYPVKTCYGLQECLDFINSLFEK